LELEAKLRVGIRVGLGVGLGASELLIADCQYAIRGDLVPVVGYMTKIVTPYVVLGL